MKIILIILLSISFSFSGLSQLWLDSLPKNKSKNELTLFDYQKAFNSFWDKYHVENGYYLENGQKKKAAGWKQFKRWEYDMMFKIDKQTGVIPIISYDEIFNSKDEIEKSASTWKCLGTTNSEGGYNGIGRINCIAFHPTNNNVFWVGSASGGVWVTNNNGLSWTNLTDNLNVFTVSNIIISPDYDISHTIYISTGDRFGWSDNQSVGVLKSIDGGLTWNSTGLSFSFNSQSMIYKMVMNPSNQLELIASTSSGVYKTNNGGTSWNLQLSPLVFYDIEFNPNNSSILYGSTTDGKIYTSLNGGSNWSLSFSNSTAKSIELAVSVNQSSWVYGVAINSGGNLEGIYKSTNNGNSFNQVFSGTTKNLLSYDANGANMDGVGWYTLSAEASPLDANILVVGGINTWRSINGASSFQIINHWSGDQVQAVHTDKHLLKYKNNGELFEGNDGGLYRSLNNGNNWIDITNGMAISQMYRLSSSQNTKDQILTGSQDNGVKLDKQGIWKSVHGGDGTDCLIDYSNSLIQYGSHQYGYFAKTTDGWNTSIPIANSYSTQGGWITPIAINPAYPNQIFLGYSDLIRSINSGATWTTLTAINSSSKINCITISKSNPQQLCISDWNNIYKSIDNGISWVNINGSLPLSSNSITSIAIKGDDPNTIWITLSGFNSDKVFESTNGGLSWNNISNGLPSIPIYSIIQNTQSIGSVQLYVGTQKGIYYKSGTNNWVAFNTGLPLLQVNDIDIYYDNTFSNSKLRAATFGRGLWECSVNSPNVPYTILTNDSDSTVCSGTPAQLNIPNFTQGSTIHWEKSQTGYSDWLTISGVNSSNYTTPNLTMPSYYRSVITSNGSTITTNPLKINVQSCANVNELVLEKLSISPNPSSGLINVKLSDDFIKSIIIFDVEGKKVYSNEFEIEDNEFGLDLRNLKKGLYNIKIFTCNKTVESKIVLE